jgi:DNA replication and repair protein RecF
MALVSLEIGNFRCIEHAELELDPRCTAIIGANAAGKTSTLEAIHVLSTGRSFRTLRNELLLGTSNNQEFLVCGRVRAPNQHLTLGLKWGTAGREVRLNGTKCRGFAPLAAALPVQVIDPGAHKLLEEGPSQRRRYVDWGVFHVEPSFVETWRSYNTALIQRNAALKTQQDQSLIRTWDGQLAITGENIGQLRDRYVAELSPVVGQFSIELLGAAATLEINRGWDRGATLSESLRTSLSRDLRLRTTSVGPHRAELAVRIEGVAAKDRISRGQQKLLACALVLAQLQHRVTSGLDPACLLLDDPAAELDVNNLGKLLQLIAAIPAQLVVTAVESRTIDAISPGNMFHVKQGRVAKML